MSVEDLFLAALDHPDAKARSEYLDRSCNGDATLRAQVEELLAAHFRSGEFLDVPAIEQVRPDPDEANTMTFQGDSVSGRDHDPEELGFLSPSQRPDSLGRIGHYEVLQVLGKGGFGIVFRAFDDVLQRVVAIKVMAPQLAATSPARKRFLREARTSAQVRHENVVQVYEVAEHPLPYLAMEFIPGETLQQKLDRNGPLDVAEVLRIGRQIAEGLAAAHATDLIHRDIKPANVLIEGGPRQQVKITDFGLARAADDASISQSGVIAGTPMYMAPEQALGDKLDQRADLFSLGSVLYQMVSGRAPFRANSTLAVLKRVADDTPRAIREIIPDTPQWLCAIIAKLHAKNPDERYQSAREVADVLADCESQLKDNAKLKDFSRIPTSQKPAAGESSRRMWAVAATAVLVVPMLALAAMEIGGVTHLLRKPRATTDAIEPVADSTPPQAADRGIPDSDGWVQLFNGKDLTGWKALSRDAWKWEVASPGELVGRGANSYLFSELTDYENFHFRIEAQINDGANGGQMFRVDPVLPQLPKPGTEYPINGYEADIATFSNATTGSLLYPGKQDEPWVHIPAPGLVRGGEWFKQEVIARGNHIVILVNGQKVVDHVDPRSTFRRGCLALQAYGPNAVVRFRKIEIKELPAGGAEAPLPPTFKNNIGMEFVIVPKGKSWLGGGNDKLGDKEVEIPTDFYLGKYEVTQEEWEKVMGENPSHFSRTGDGKDAVKDIAEADLKRFPLENVTWDQCQLFVAKLNQREKDTGWVYRLPTEAEWEYACRGGPMANKRDCSFDFYFAKPSNSLLPEQANFESGKGLKRTGKVGLYQPNSLGLYDLHGNVWEWCDDTEKGPEGVSLRVNRGGGWNCEPESCRAGRDPQFGGASAPSERHPVLGLRLAHVPAGAASPDLKAPLTAAPFDAAKAKALQESWAKKLGVPVEYTNSLGMKFRLVPPGTFTMGSSKDEIDRCLKVGEGIYKGADLDWNRDRIVSEGPAHEVEITKPFYLGTTPVTFGQFRKFVAAEKYAVGNDLWEKPGWDQTDNHPIVAVSMRNANDFCRWLGKADGQEYRLPTEAEWEYACRAGTTTRYWFGDDDGKLPDHGWFKDNSKGQAQPVGKFPANPWGLFDLYGNVWQWCGDLHDPKWYAKSPKKDPVGTGDGYLIRGSTWQSPALGCRSAARNCISLSHRPDTGNGFRVALTVDAVRQAVFTDADAKRIGALPVGEQVEEVSKELVRRNPGFDGKVEHKIEDGVITELKLITDEITDISPVRALTGLGELKCDGSRPRKGQLADLSPLKDMKLTFLSCMDTQVANLSPLKGLKLTQLYFSYTLVSDLSPLMDMKLTRMQFTSTKATNLEPLKEMRLQRLTFNSTSVSDLSPLQNMNLQLLHFSDTPVSDLSPLKGMMLENLWCNRTKVTDISVLSGMPLKGLSFDFQPKRDVEILRSLNTLLEINGKPAAEFWKEVDKK